jgi:hypothetical protein
MFKKLILFVAAVIVLYGLILFVLVKTNCSTNWGIVLNLLFMAVTFVGTYIIVHRPKVKIPLNQMKTASIIAFIVSAIILLSMFIFRDAFSSNLLLFSSACFVIFILGCVFLYQLSRKLKEVKNTHTENKKED